MENQDPVVEAPVEPLEPTVEPLEPEVTTEPTPEVVSPVAEPVAVIDYEDDALVMVLAPYVERKTNDHISAVFDKTGRIQ
jgi:hypothetical protein